MDLPELRVDGDHAVTAALLVIALYVILKAYHVVVFVTTLYSSPR